MVLGEYLSEKDNNVVIIGADLIQAYALEDDTQKRLNVNVGDTVRLDFQRYTN